VDLTISIVYTYEKDYLENCVRTIFESKPACEFEVYVVDNFSKHDVPQKVCEKYPSVKFLRTEHLYSFSASNNWVIGRAKGEFVLLMNPDIETLPGSIDNLVKTMSENPDVGALGGMLLSKSNHKPQVGFNVRRYPTVRSTTFELLLLDKLFPHSKIMRKSNMLDFDYTKPAMVEQPAGACLMIRKSALKDTGYLDEKFHPVWYEDVDICRRMYLYNWKVMYTPEARFLHIGGMGVQRLSKSQATLSRFSNLVYYYRKHHGTLWSYYMKVMVVIAALIRIKITLLSFAIPDKLLSLLDFPIGSQKKVDIIKAHFKVIRMILKNVHTYMLEESGHLTNKFKWEK
jgi:N-acetylglucosaminyl-diphospho-decaprenol L-rhamnosyltransferase